MSRAQKMFQKPQEKPILPDTKNFDGYPAFTVSKYEQYVQMCMVNTVGNTYYMSGDDLFKYSLALHEKMRNEDPTFMAKAIVYARNNGLMRMQPVVGLAYLSLVPDKSLFHSAFMKVIKTPGDLMDFVAVVGSIRKGKGFGRTIKRAINNWLTGEGYEYRQEGLTQYHAIKYGGGESGKKWTLKDIVKLAHPTPKNTTQSALFKYVVDGESNAALEQVMAIEALKTLAGQRKEIGEVEFSRRACGIIDTGRLPFEIVTGIIKPDTVIWEHLMAQMPIFALVRNLRTLEEAGVFSKSANASYVVGQLQNAEIISRSKMLPFRFTTAHKQFTGNQNVRNALAKSLDLSLDNVGVLPGRNAFFLDVSGSMNGDYVEIGSILALAALKKSADSMFLCFGSDLKLPRVNTADTVMTNVKAVMDVFGGGTSTDLCLKYLLGSIGHTTSRSIWGGGGYASGFPESQKTKAPTKVDNIVIVTDEQQNSGSPVVNEFRQYRKTVNPNAKLFIIDVAPYTGRVANQDEPGVTFIYGWSESVLDVLKYAMEGNGTHVDQVSRVRL